jgi:hypothetical protein
MTALRMRKQGGAREMPCVREEYVHDCRREAGVFPEWRT